jgi:heme A synthase
MKKISTLKIIMLFVKGLTGVLGASMVLSQQNPILTVCVLAVGAGTVEVLNYIDSNTPKNEKA